MRLLKAQISSRNIVKAKYKQVEVGINGIDDAANTTNEKSSDKAAHRDLVGAFQKMAPHLLFQTQLIDSSIAIPADMEPETYFSGFHFDNDPRFEGVFVKKIQTYGKETVDGVKIWGYKVNKHKHVCPLETGVIYFNRDVEDYYPLAHIVSAQFETLDFEINEHITTGKNENTITNQMQLFDK